MHIVHLIAVEADDEEEAVEAAEEGLEPYGEGNVWDWFVIGGRWEGYLDGENTCNAAKKPGIFSSALDTVQEMQDSNFREIRDRLTGRQLTVEEVPDHIIGLPVQDKEFTLARINEDNAKWKKSLDLMLSVKDLKTWHLISEKEGHMLLSYYLRQLGKILDGGHYYFDAHFWDPMNYTTRVDMTRMRALQDPIHQWLVVADLHN